jgi:pimeloyl-ACP methyl ester carboxylesterase
MKTVRVNGVDLAYSDEGSGPVVLMQHGFPDTFHSWDAVRPALVAAGFRVVTPALRGYHPSAVPSDRAYGAETLGHDLLGVLGAVSPEPAVVVGHDWGALAAYAAASLAPEKLRFLVTVAIPHPASVRPSFRLAWAVRHFVTLRLPGAARRVRRNDFAHLDELVRRWSPAWSFSPEETRAVKQTFSEPGCLEAALDFYRALGPLPRLLRRKIEVPAAAFVGDSDLLAPAAYEAARRRYARSYQVVTMPGGHFLHREHPEVFSRELLRLLRASA